MLLSNLLTQASALSSILNGLADINALDAARIVGTSHKLLSNVVKDAAANIDLEASKKGLENAFNGVKDAVANVDMEASKQALEQAFKNAQHAAANVNLENSKEVLENVFKAAKEADYLAMAAQINPENFQRASEQARDWIKENPKQAACIGISAAIFVAPGLVSSPALAMTGFGADGVVGASMAAGVHSGIGNVAAGSGFAILESAGAAGAGLASVNGVVQGAALTAGAATVAKACLEEEAKKIKSKL